MKVLVVGAHPDDEILGAGGTIAKHIENGDEVYICVVTRAYLPEYSDGYHAQKVASQKEVDEYLGITKRFNLDIKTVTLNTIPHGKLNSRIGQVFKEVEPDVCYTHFEHDMNLDHTLVFNACMVATRPPRRIQLLCMEVASETEWNNKPFVPNIYNMLDKSHIDKKLKAFSFYSTEVGKYPHPRSLEGLSIRAQARGMEICTEYAEAFIQIRGYK